MIFGQRRNRDSDRPQNALLQGRILMRRCATVTDARRIGMRPQLVRAVVIDAILENMGRMRSLAAGAHRETARRNNETLFNSPERGASAGAVQWVCTMRKGARGDRRRAGAET
jgi:hypothetical protein